MAEKAVLKRLGVLSVAKLYALGGAIGGLIFGILIVIFGAAIGGAGGAFFAAMGIFSIITFPIIYGISGFIAGAAFAFLYNLLARWTGGIEMYFEG